jgi:cobalamin synthase
MAGSWSSRWYQLLLTAALALVLYADQNETLRRPERTWVAACVLSMFAATIMGVPPTLLSVAALVVASTAITLCIERIRRSFR